MKAITKILLPTDFSESSEQAAATAMHLAKVFNAKIRLLHVAEMNVLLTYGDTTYWPSMNMEEKIREAAAMEMKKFAEKTHLPAGIETHIDVFTGSIGDRICNDAAEHGIDLIVMSTHGRTGVNRLLLGSVTERVVRVAGCPVFVVPKTHKG